MVLTAELAQILTETRCDVQQTECHRCGEICTFVRVSGNILPISECGCDYERMKARILRNADRWERYPMAQAEAAH